MVIYFPISSFVKNIVKLRYLQNYFPRLVTRSSHLVCTISRSDISVNLNDLYHHLSSSSSTLAAYLHLLLSDVRPCVLLQLLSSNSGLEGIFCHVVLV